MQVCNNTIIACDKNYSLNLVKISFFGGIFDRSIHNTVYRDFKSHNILLRDDGHLVSTVFWESNTDKSFSNAAISLLSPEIIKRLRSKQRSDSADIKKQTDYEDHVSMWWSFGVFLYICLVGKVRTKNSYFDGKC
jgi:serine/threonine protein kinase